MKNLYLLLSFLGAIIPYLFFFKFIDQNGLNIPLFLESLFVNGAAGGFSADLFISSAAFWLFIYSDQKLNKLWAFILITLTIGLSCALPLYFYFRTKNNK